MIEGITMGQVLSKLIGVAASRFGVPIVQRIGRVKEIEAALDGSMQKDRATSDAFRDFEVVVGSVYGELTQELHGFLQELERSGLLTAIAEAAVLEIPSESTKKAFLRLHDVMVTSKSGDGENLYKRIYLAIGTSLRALSKDPAGAFLDRAAAKDLRSRVDIVSAQLGSLLSQPEPVASPVEAKALLESYLQAVVGDLKHLRVETHRGPRPVEISKIYVPSRVRPRNAEDAARLGRARRRLARSPNAKGILFDVERINSSLSYEELKVTFRRIVVLGDPGGGKSTLCQSICHDFAKKSLLRIRHPERKELDTKAERVPIRIVLRSFEATKKNSQLGLFDYICSEIRNETDADLRLIERSVRYLLNFGRAVLAFDGLDEILDVGRRRDFVKLVENFCEHYPLCPAIVTSRIVGYEEAPLRDDFSPMVLDRFGDLEVAQYVEKFLRALEKRTPEEARELAKDFVRQTESNAADLRQNPLMLGLMTLLFSYNNGDIPSNRPEIYRECSTLMFEKWDQNRSIRAQIPQFDFLDLFRTFAFQIFGNAELEEGVTKDWILKQNIAYFSNYFENKAKAYEAAVSVTRFITGRSWLMDEFGPNVFRFTHRTFLEYYFAQHLDQKHETLAELMAFLRPKILAREWDVICHLAIQIKASRNMTRIALVLTYLSKQIEAVKGRKSLAAVVEFAAKALEYLPGTERDVGSLVTAIANASFRLSSDPKYSAVEVIHQLCNAGVERREFIRSILIQKLSEKLKRNDFERRAAIWMLSSGPDRIFWGEALFNHRSTILPAELREKVIVACRSHNYERALQSVQDAFLYWTWYRDDFDQLFGIHGLGLFLERTPDTNRVIGIVDCWRILTSASGGSEQGLMEKEAAINALRVIGKLQLPLATSLQLTSPAYVRIPVDTVVEPVNKLALLEPVVLRGALICFVILVEASVLIDIYRAQVSARPRSASISEAVAAIQSSIEKSRSKRPKEAISVDFDSLLGWLNGGWSLFEGRGIRALRRAGSD